MKFTQSNQKPEECTLCTSGCVNSSSRPPVRVCASFTQPQSGILYYCIAITEMVHRMQFTPLLETIKPRSYGLLGGAGGERVTFPLLPRRYYYTPALTFIGTPFVSKSLLLWSAPNHKICVNCHSENTGRPISWRTLVGCSGFIATVRILPSLLSS